MIKDKSVRLPAALSELIHGGKWGKEADTNEMISHSLPAKLVEEKTDKGNLGGKGQLYLGRSGRTFREELPMSASGMILGVSYTVSLTPQPPCMGATSPTSQIKTLVIDPRIHSWQNLELGFELRDP